MGLTRRRWCSHWGGSTESNARVASGFVSKCDGTGARFRRRRSRRPRRIVGYLSTVTANLLVVALYLWLHYQAMADLHLPYTCISLFDALPNELLIIILRLAQLGGDSREDTPPSSPAVHFLRQAHSARVSEVCSRHALRLVSRRWKEAVGRETRFYCNDSTWPKLLAALQRQEADTDCQYRCPTSLYYNVADGRALGTLISLLGVLPTLTDLETGHLHLGSDIAWEPHVGGLLRLKRLVADSLPYSFLRRQVFSVDLFCAPLTARSHAGYSRVQTRDCKSSEWAVFRIHRQLGLRSPLLFDDSTSASDLSRAMSRRMLRMV